MSRGTIDKDEYLSSLRKREGNTRVSRGYQFAGLELAEILGDPEHKALYIKLAKEHGTGKLMTLAKDIAGKKDVKNKGAYFMRVLHGETKKK